MNIKGEHEDRIYVERTFIRELMKVQDDREERLFQELFPHYKDLIDEENFRENLFDYIYNYDGGEDFGGRLEELGYV
jgi:hypothetical protein